MGTPPRRHGTWTRDNHATRKHAAQARVSAASAVTPARVSAASAVTPARALGHARRRMGVALRAHSNARLSLRVRPPAHAHTPRTESPCEHALTHPNTRAALWAAAWAHAAHRPWRDWPHGMAPWSVSAADPLQRRFQWELAHVHDASPQSAAGFARGGGGNHLNRVLGGVHPCQLPPSHSRTRLPLTL